MIPVSLTIQGIYSYQSRQTIDFTRLTKAGIFGIFGSVGSGKSTILEAITYALYGRTDRLNLSGDNRNYNMMNLKSNEMYIDFVFKTGVGQTEYLASVRSRRNSKQFDDVKACDRTAYKKMLGTWVPIDIESLEVIIGLSYDNFKRTIIIPQGKFQEFLMLSSKERTLMMKELFNLERFELYYKVASLESKANQQKQNFEGNLQQLGEIFPEQITALESQLSVTIKEIEFKIAELNKLQFEEAKIIKIKELSEKSSALNTQLTELRKQEQGILSLEKQISSYEFCLINFKTLIQSVESASLNIHNIKKNIEADEVSSRANSVELRKLEESFENIRKAFENREILKQKSEELSKIIRILDLNDRYKNFLLRIENGEKLITDTTIKIESLKKQIESCLLEQRGLKEQTPDMNRLTKAKEWFFNQQVLFSTSKEIESENKLLKAELDDLDRQRADLFNSDSFTGISLLNDYNSIICEIEEKKKTHLTAIEILNSEMHHFQVQQKLEEYATGLNDGKPCPLCGSLSHPSKFNAQNIAESIAKTKMAIEDHQKIILTFDLAEKKLTEINTIFCFKEDSLKKVQQKKNENDRKLQLHQALFCWEEFKSENDLLLMFEKAEQTQKEIVRIEKEFENLRQILEKEVNQKELYVKAIESIKDNSLKELATANTLREQIILFNVSDFQNTDPEVISKHKDEFLEQYKAIEIQYQSILSQINNLRKIQDTIQGKLEANRKTLDQELSTYQEYSAKLNEQLKNSSWNSQEEIKDILSWNLDLEKERKKISAFRQQFDFIEKQLENVSKELNGNVFDPDKYKLLILNIESLNQNLSLKNQEKGKIEENLTRLKQDFVERQKFLELLNAVNARLENLKTLKQLFKGGGFVKYISSVYLHELIKSANERFYKLTGQKLSLEMNSENEFEVRDFMNGGKLRNVKTLSGGQTFQAALSLALALSDNTRKLSGADENFFFLDEGFGSLDKDSLQIVFETLKALRHENRVVGIISHVEEMKQEIDTHLQVVNHEEKGSYIERSWEKL